jgi:hypothetical protein
MNSTTDALLTGLSAKLDALVREARERGKTDARQAVEAMTKAAVEQMAKIDKRIDKLAARHSLEPALWGAAGGVLLAVLMLILGVWMGDRGVTVRWLLTFGAHL